MDDTNLKSFYSMERVNEKNDYVDVLLWPMVQWIKIGSTVFDSVCYTSRRLLTKFIDPSVPLSCAGIISNQRIKFILIGIILWLFKNLSDISIQYIAMDWRAKNIKFKQMQMF